MIIFLYGSDSYRSRQKLEEIITHYKASGKTGLNLLRLDASQTDFADFYDNFRTSSMFAEKKLVILKNVFAHSTSSGQAKKFQEDFAQEIKNIENLKDVVVVYENEAPDARLKLFKMLLKGCKCQEFVPLDGRQAKAWAQKECEKMGSKINVDALDLLLSYAGSDLWRLSGEISKLSSFKKDSTIKKDDVQLMVRPNIETDIFKTIDAFAAKNKPQALSLLQKHMDNGEEPLYILSMMAWGFKNLLVVKELSGKGLMYNSMVKKSGLHPFVVKKNYFASQQFSLDELKEIYRKIYRVDHGIKTGKIEAETALDLLVAAI